MSALPRSSPRAVLALLVVTVLWGWTFVWMKQGVTVVEEQLGPEGLVAGVGLFMTLRFGIAALVILLLPSARRGFTPGVLKGGFVIGALLLAGFLLQMFGLQGVSAPVSAFLTSLYVVFTALLTAARDRRGIGLPLVIGALLATFGAGFIQGPPQLAFGLAEWLTVGCAFVFAAHILATETITKREAPMPVTTVAFFVTAAGGLATLAVGMVGEGAPTGSQLIGLATLSSFAGPMILASLFATVLALSLMNTFQRELDPVRAAILYAIEPVWATVIAIGMGQASLGLWLMLGGGALVAGNLVAELAPVGQKTSRKGELPG
jgi:drug/metabolite transporter (DMT)-like permease